MSFFRPCWKEKRDLSQCTICIYENENEKARSRMKKKKKKHFHYEGQWGGRWKFE